MRFLDRLMARHVCIDLHSHTADAVVSVASHEKHDPCIRMTRRGFDSSRKRIAIRGAAVRFTMLRSNRDRTQAACHLYAFTLFCVMMLGLRKTIVSVENRSSSYLWLVMYQFCKQSEMLLAIWLALEQVHFSSMDAWLGQRYKWTCWYSTPEFWKRSSQVCRPTQP